MGGAHLLRYGSDDCVLFCSLVKNHVTLSNNFTSALLVMTDASQNAFPAAGRIRRREIAPTLQVGKLQPQAVELEQAVLGALMLEKDALSKVVDVVQPDIFYKDQHKLIFEAIHTLFNNSEPVDILTVTNQLRLNGTLELAGGAFYITELTGKVASAANIEFHARIVAQKHIQRELIRICGEVQRDAYEDTTDVFDLLDTAEQELFSLSENNLRRDSLSARDLISTTIKSLEEMAKRDDHITGVSTGFRKLDELTSGWQKSDLVIIAARPAMGKTAFVLSVARHAAVQRKVPVAFFSLEMSATQIAQRLLSAQAELELNRLRTGKLEQYEWTQLNTRSGELSSAPLYINDTPALSLYDLRAKCRRLKAEKQIQLIIIDYLQLMSAGNNKAGNREQEIAYISRGLKELAKELDIPVIALSQLSRAVETRTVGDKRPQLSDLRESGSIEQDADMVMFLYRPEYYGLQVDEEGNSTKDMAEVIIGKQRNGPTDTVKLMFTGRYARFSELPGNYGSGGMGGGGSFIPYQKPDDLPIDPYGNPLPPTDKPRLTFPSKMNSADDDVIEGDWKAPF